MKTCIILVLFVVQAPDQPPFPVYHGAFDSLESCDRAVVEGVNDYRRKYPGTGILGAQCRKVSVLECPVGEGA